MPRDPITHELKTHPEPYDAIFIGCKTAEFRRNDRDFQVNDHLKLMEWDPATKTYSSRFIVARISHIIFGPAFGIPEGFATLSFKGAIDQDGKVIQ